MPVTRENESTYTRLSDQIAWRGRKFIVTLGLVALIALAVFTSQNKVYDVTYYQTTMRNQFHLVEDVEFAEFQYPRRKNSNTNWVGVVQFNDKQFQHYREQILRTGVWNPVPYEFGNFSVKAPYSPKALTWQPLPLPPFAGNRRIRVGKALEQRIGKIRTGSVYCLAFRQPKGQRRADWVRDAPDGKEAKFPLETPELFDQYNALHCSEFGRSESPGPYVLGVLDNETKKLYMTIR